MSARTRVDQAQPILGKRDCRVKGNMTPPTAPPVAARPVAVPRRLSNQWATAESEGVKRREEPMPPRTEKERIKCQYSISYISNRNSWEDEGRRRDVLVHIPRSKRLAT